MNKIVNIALSALTLLVINCADLPPQKEVQTDVCQSPDASHLGHMSNVSGFPYLLILHTIDANRPGFVFHSEITNTY